MKNHFGIIPSLTNIDELNALSLGRSLFFEYNDFFSPLLLEDEHEFMNRIKAYSSIDRDFSQDTLHGAFLDVNPASDDPQIVKVSRHRVEQSLMAARSLGVKGVIFHTNYLSCFHLIGYRKTWVSRSVDFYSEILESNKDLTIYVENMFDESPELLAALAKGLEGYSNFGVCLDYAHSRVFGQDPEGFVTVLAPYVKHMHINDNFGESDDHLALGQGDIDWELFTRLMDSHGLNREDVSILIEMQGLEKISRSLDYIKDNF